MSYTWTPMKPDPDTDLTYVMNAGIFEKVPKEEIIMNELPEGPIMNPTVFITNYKWEEDDPVVFLTDSYRVVRKDDTGTFTFYTRTVVTKKGSARVVLRFVDEEEEDPSKPRMLGDNPFHFMEYVAPLFVLKPYVALLKLLLFKKPTLLLENDIRLTHTSSPFLKNDDTYERFACLFKDSDRYFRETKDRRDYIESAIDVLLAAAKEFWNLKALINANGSKLDRLIKDILFQPTEDKEKS